MNSPVSTASATCSRFGGGDYSMRVWLDPEKVASGDWTTGDVVAAIREQNVQVAAGQLGRLRRANGANFQLAINTKAASATRRIRHIIVKTGAAADGPPARRGADRIGLGTTTRCAPCSTIAPPWRSLFSSAPQQCHRRVDAVRSNNGETEKSFPEGIDYNVAYDPTCSCAARSMPSCTR